jgi:hypothetical protein
MKSTKAKFPGWRMTDAQHALYFRLWAAACAQQGWDTLPASAREAKRHEIQDRLFGEGKSAKDINATAEFDAIKQCFERLAMLVPSPGGEGQGEDDLAAGARRRLLNVAGQKLSELGELCAADYIETLLKDRFKVVKGVRSITDLSDKSLSQLIMTVNNRITLLARKAA